MSQIAQDEVSTTDVETSGNEEVLDTDAELELENDDASFEDEDNEETEEQSDEDESANESEDDEESDSDEAEKPKDKETKEEDTPSEEERKRHNDEMAQKRIAAREAKEALKRQQQGEYLQSAQDVYDIALQRGLSEEEARMEMNRDLAVKQLQVDAYNNRVTFNNSALETGIDRAVADIDLFRNGSAEVKEELARSLDDFERMYVVRDQNDEPVDVKADVYQYLHAKADSIRRLTSVGARNQTRANNKTKARTDTLPTRAPKEAKKDDLLDGFDEEASRW